MSSQDSARSSASLLQKMLSNRATNWSTLEHDRNSINQAHTGAIDGISYKYKHLSVGKDVAGTLLTWLYLSSVQIEHNKVQIQKK